MEIIGTVVLWCILGIMCQILSRLAGNAISRWLLSRHSLSEQGRAAAQKMRWLIELAIWMLLLTAIVFLHSFVFRGSEFRTDRAMLPGGAIIFCWCIAGYYYHKAVRIADPDESPAP